MSAMKAERGGINAIRGFQIWGRCCRFVLLGASALHLSNMLTGLLRRIHGACQDQDPRNRRLLRSLQRVVAPQHC